MNPTIILTCILFLLPMYANLYRQQPYFATQLVGYISKAYFFLSGTVLSVCSLLIIYVAITEKAPMKSYILALILLAFGFYIARNSLKK